MRCAPYKGIQGATMYSCTDRDVCRETCSSHTNAQRDRQYCCGTNGLKGVIRSLSCDVNTPKYLTVTSYNCILLTALKRTYKLDRACQSYGDQVDCQECCNGSFCNVAGCGDDGLPSFQSRGPFCFDCEHQGEEVCQTVQMCRPNQVCKIEKYEWGSGYHNIMGCADYQVCNSKRDARETHARHAPVCSHCCHSDFCNMNCTAAHVQQIIG